MRPFGLTLAVLVAAGPAVFAQAPAGSPVKSAGGSEPVLPAAPVLSEKNQKALDYFLKKWEDRMAGITTLEAKCAMTEISIEDGKQEKRVSTGEASLMKPNYAKLFLKDPENPGNQKRIKHIVADGEILWDFTYWKKVATVQKLPANGVGDNTLMSFLFGMKAAQLKERYHLAVDVEDPKRYNKNYLHISVLPKTRADLQEFKKAELVLWVSAEEDRKDVLMLPARIWFQDTNNNQVMWDFANLTTQKKLTAKSFAPPPFPDKQWTSEWAKPPAPAPDVIRPTSGTAPAKK